MERWAPAANDVSADMGDFPGSSSFLTRNGYLANKPDDSEWCVLPITNIEAYLGSSSLSKSYILLLSGRVLERKAGTSNVCVARFYLPE